MNILANTSKDIKILLLYNLFIFDSTQRNYFIYKRELYVIIIFYKKYDYVCKHPYKSTIVYTNYKFLIYFLSLDLYEDIYRN